MRVRFYGVRGSIPTPGPSTVRYGGNSVCVEVRLADGSCIVLDAGSGIRDLGNDLAREGYRESVHLFITHGHWDHILGLPFFAPIYDPRTHLIIHAATDRARHAVRNPVVFDGAHFPVKFADLPARIDRLEDYGEHRVGSATVRHIELHHPGGATGYRIDDADGTSMCYLTDNELEGRASDELVRFAEGCGLLVHDAQYLPADMPAKRGWGHSIVGDVLALARSAEARQLALHHHDPERHDDALDAIAADADAWAREHAPALRAVVAREGMIVEPKA